MDSQDARRPPPWLDAATLQAARALAARGAAEDAVRALLLARYPALPLSLIAEAAAGCYPPPSSAASAGSSPVVARPRGAA